MVAPLLSDFVLFTSGTLRLTLSLASCKSLGLPLSLRQPTRTRALRAAAPRTRFLMEAFCTLLSGKSLTRNKAKPVPMEIHGIQAESLRDKPQFRILGS